MHIPSKIMKAKMNKILIIAITASALCSCSVASTREEMILRNTKFDYDISYFDDYAMIEVNQIEMGVTELNGVIKRKNAVPGPQVKVGYNKPFSEKMGGLMDNAILVNFTVSGNITKVGPNILHSKVVLASDPFGSP